MSRKMTPKCATTKEVAETGIGRVVVGEGSLSAPAGSANIHKLTERFLAWPLPDSVCSDQCACIRGYRHRSGTNLLTYDEAHQMLEYLLCPPNNKASQPHNTP